MGLSITCVSLYDSRKLLKLILTTIPWGTTEFILALMFKIQSTFPGTLDAFQNLPSGLMIAKNYNVSMLQ